jgi:hypothetical protein
MLFPAGHGEQQQNRQCHDDAQTRGRQPLSTQGNIKPIVHPLGYSAKALKKPKFLPPKPATLRFQTRNTKP